MMKSFHKQKNAFRELSVLRKSLITQAQISISATCQVDSLLLEVFDELLGFVVLLLQSLVLRLRLLQVLVDRVAEGLRFDPVALQLQHPLLVLLDAGLQLALLLLPALLLPLHGRQLSRDGGRVVGTMVFGSVLLPRPRSARRRSLTFQRFTLFFSFWISASVTVCLIWSCWEQRWKRKRREGEERRGWSDHQMHGCTSTPSTVGTEGGWRQRTSQPQRPGTARSEINILSGGRSQLSPLKCEKCKMFKRIDGKLEEPSSQGQPRNGR